MSFKRNLLKRWATTLLAAAAVLFGASVAQANNEYTQLLARTCLPDILGGCTDGYSAAPLENGLNVGGAFAFASGFNGGTALVSAVFAPGAAPLLPAGLYRQAAGADYYYSFQIRGAPDTLVPLHLFGNVNTAAIHLTDAQGQVVDLVDGTHSGTSNWRVVTSIGLQIMPVRLTANPVNGAALSLEGLYETNGSDYFCRFCDGQSAMLDQTLWFYSNSDINVHLGGSMLLDYMAFGEGLDPFRTFATVSASADPVFTIDDPAYSAFSIVGVPTGFAPPTGSTVPEPASWAFLVTGFGITGGLMRRRKSDDQVFDPTV